MRKIFFILTFFFLATACHAGHTIIQQNNCIGARPGSQYLVNCPFTNPNIAGDGIVVVTIGNGIQYPSCEPQGGVNGDTNGNTYHSAGQGLDGSNTLQNTEWVAFNIVTGSNTVTFQCNSFDYISVYIYEVQGAIGQPNLIDQTNSATCTGTSCSPLSTGNVITTQNNEIIFAVEMLRSVSQAVYVSSWSDSAGWTNPVSHNDPQDGSTFMSSHVANMIVTSTGTYADSISYTGGPSSPTVVAFIASFSFGPPLCSPTPTQVAKCTALQNPSNGLASCSITVIPGDVVVIAGSVRSAYTVTDSNGWIASGLFQQFQSFTDPGGGANPIITEGVSAFGAGSHSGTDTFGVQQTQFNVGASIVVTEWSGLAGGNVSLGIVADSSVGNTANAGGSGNISGGNLTPSQVGDVLVVFGIAAANGQTLSIGAGYTQDENYNYTGVIVPTYVTAAQESEIGLSTGPFAANFSTSASGLWAITGIALSPQSCTLRPRNRTQVY